MQSWAFTGKLFNSTNLAFIFVLKRCALMARCPCLRCIFLRFSKSAGRLWEVNCDDFPVDRGQQVPARELNKTSDLSGTLNTVILITLHMPETDIRTLFITYNQLHLWGSNWKRKKISQSFMGYLLWSIMEACFLRIKNKKLWDITLCNFVFCNGAFISHNVILFLIFLILLFSFLLWNN